MNEVNIERSNIILADIDQSLLTPEEREKITKKDNVYAVYYSLATVLRCRGVEGKALEKLEAHALISGYTIHLGDKDKIKSSLFVGASLD